MEPEVLAFFKRISKSLLLGLLWLGITAVAAIKNDNAFIEGKIRVANVLFYIWLVGSAFVMVKIFYKLWTAVDDPEQPKTN